MAKLTVTSQPEPGAMIKRFFSTCHERVSKPAFSHPSIMISNTYAHFLRSSHTKMSFKRTLTGLAALVVLGLTTKCGDINTTNYDSNNIKNSKYETSASYNTAPKVKITFPDTNYKTIHRNTCYLDGYDGIYFATKVSDPDHDRIIKKLWCEYDAVAAKCKPIAERELDIRDPTKSKTAVCTYPNTPKGYKTIRFCATDEHHAKRCKNRIIDVLNWPPVADAGNDSWGKIAGLDVVPLDGSASSDSDGGIALCEWDSTNDGFYEWISTTSCSTSHVYPSPGNFNAKLRVTDLDGDTATDTKFIEIN